MLDARSRVTVVGTRKRVDVAVPTAAPIGEYVIGLADLCGQERGSVLPHSWSLAPAAAAALPLDASMGSSGITDGQVLYLRDLARDPDADPVVEDVDELVAVKTRSDRDASVSRGLVVLAFGLLWLGATGALALWSPGSLLGDALLLIMAGLTLLGAGWSLHQRETAVPGALRLLVPLTALPCLSIAGALVAEALSGPQARWCGAIGGVNVAALMALAAVPEAVLIALEVQFAAAAVLTVLLVLARADSAQVAAATVVMCLALLAQSKMLSAFIAVWSKRPPRGAASLSHVVTDLLVRSRQLLGVVIAGPTAALAVSFVVLCASGNTYAVALSAVAGVALLVRARRGGLTTEVALTGGGGLVGIFCALVAVLARYAGSPAMIAVLAASGLGLVGTGLLATMMRRRPEPSVLTATLAGGVARGAGVAQPMGGVAVRPNRLRFIDTIGVLCHLACVSLALGVFGVFTDMVGMGRTIVG